MSALQVIWFMLIGVLLAVYAILDGFDLGVGFWHLFTKKDKDRRTLLNSIGPVWDGNEVWLLAGGGALFAAFPPVYATTFSGFYLALMLVLFALILRAVSVEFRHQSPSPGWRKTWDRAFWVGSTLPALLFGVAVGNIIRGIPLDAAGEYAGTFLDLLNPYALVIGLVGFAMFLCHGALYIILKTEGELAQQARRWAQKAWVAYGILFVVAALATVLTQERPLSNYKEYPILWVIPILALAAVGAIGMFLRKDQPQKAFVASCLSILLLVIMSAASMFPNLVPNLDDASKGLTLANSSSTGRTLGTMLVLAIIGMPFVIGYTIWIYRAFWGKATADEEGY